MATYQDYYDHARYLLCMPHESAVEWANEQVRMDNEARTNLPT
jgi:hypothetical protein